ncbi:MAG: EscU/YscU/HrcU family type III secretion system export apparatus switch protein [Helicobacter sp.]|nr:EscU/YscU/HrcU family type III secretion system export apparatus switch protein [Helicobacter sp.]
MNKSSHTELANLNKLNGTNATKAVALAYQKMNYHAPKIVAQGRGEIANQIIKKAKQFNIALFENEQLVNALLGAPNDSFIPPELYMAVVEVFVWLAKNEQNAQASK